MKARDYDFDVQVLVNYNNVLQTAVTELEKKANDILAEIGLKNAKMTRNLNEIQEVLRNQATDGFISALNDGGLKIKNPNNKQLVN